MPDKVVSFREAFFLPMTVKRGLKVGLLVGVLLILINQGERMLQGHWPHVWEVFLTFLVPYCVSSYSSAAFISEFSRSRDKTGDVKS